MRVATWNVNSLRVRLDHLARWSDAARPDVVCLQETKVTDALFPHEAVEAMGYTHRAIHGQKTYNGVAILSRLPLENVVIGFLDGEPDPQARLLRATVAGVRLVCCYVPNGSPVGSEKFAYKQAWLARLCAELRAHHDAAAPHLLLGDLNIAPTDADVFDPFEAEGQLLATEAERSAFKALCDWGMVDAWRARNPFAAAYSWWDYRGAAFRYNHGFRIDHVLATPSLDARCTAAFIDRDPRTWDQPSDHTPVVVDLAD